ncbi:hypothetical protein MZC75_18190 [Escherichia coli]|nr:hypothetical protein [Escherichia coli]MCQ5900965.1 hypothetical protein [Escherichia coli]MCQ5922690.1 hypothetical protein [Escherichia coli]MCQ5933042.1 hypothetical protein [Escherichia coli]MCQ5943409.1 hypothetical protein [Escherichia coli]
MSVTVINEMLGCTFKEVFKNENDELVFRGDYSRGVWGTVFTFFHFQECCEKVWIEDIVGDLDDLQGEPLTEAEVVTEECDVGECHQTWSFFKFGTSKGCVTVRWCGESLGFYSERVSLKRELTDVFDFDSDF